MTLSRNPCCPITEAVLTFVAFAAPPPTRARPLLGPAPPRTSSKVACSGTYKRSARASGCSSSQVSAARYAATTMRPRCKRSCLAAGLLTCVCSVYELTSLPKLVMLTSTVSAHPATAISRASTSALWWTLIRLTNTSDSSRKPKTPIFACAASANQFAPRVAPRNPASSANAATCIASPTAMRIPEGHAPSGYATTWRPRRPLCASSRTPPSPALAAKSPRTSPRAATTCAAAAVSASGAGCVPGASLPAARTLPTTNGGTLSVRLQFFFFSTLFSHARTFASPLLHPPVTFARLTRVCIRLRRRPIH